MQAGLLVGIDERGEGAAQVRLFLRDYGALSVRAPGLLKPGSKLAGSLAPCTELSISASDTKGRGHVLTGVSAERANPEWQASLDFLALYWLMAEVLYICSSDEEENSAMLRLVFNLLRSAPATASKYSMLCVFCQRLLAINGMLLEIGSCSIDGHVLRLMETVHLLPGGDGLVGLDAYNRQYAPSGSVLLRIEPQRRKKWQQMQSGKLLNFADAGMDEFDASVWLEVLARNVEAASGSNIRSRKFLLSQWKLKQLHELLAEQHS